MLKIIVGFDAYTPWSGAKRTYERLRQEGLLDAFEEALEELYPDGIGETELNDLLWFEPEYVYEMVGLGPEEDEDDESLTETLEDNAFKDNIAKRFAEAYPGMRLLAVQLNGFSHSIFYDNGTQWDEVKQDSVSGYTSIPGSARAEQVLGLIAHAPYQNNAVEYVFVKPEDR